CSRQRDRAELRLDRAATRVARRRASAGDHSEPPHPPRPHTGADRSVRRLPRERRVGRGDRHCLPGRCRLHGVQGPGRRDGHDAVGLLMAAITLEHVTKEFVGGVIAVDDVSLTILDREFMVLVGPSGCGKSTLLRMIAGLEEITDGTISIGGRASLAQIQPRLSVTSIYVTHDQTEAMTLGHRVAVMQDGRIVQVDVPKRLYQSPNDLFVAAFIGSPSMNLVDGRVEGDTITF